MDEVVEKIRLNLKGFKGGPVLVLAVVMGVVIGLWTAWFTVQPEGTGIVQRFGKVMRTTSPGLHFKLPFGVEKVRLLPTARVLKEPIGSGFTRDRTVSRKRWALERSAGENDDGDWKRVSSASIFCNDEQESIGKETLCQRTSNL